MTEIRLREDSPRHLTFYLAMEEWVAEHLGEGFFVWSVSPTVIFGRNQDLYSEVNVPYCEQNGIEYVRRKSGGGCVYADEGNLMLSCIMPSGNVADAFSEYLGKLCKALECLGFKAVSSQHNDVLVADRKVSGNACLLHSGVAVVHGTLLYDVDFSVLDKAITPSAEKLARHAVKSVRQRVVNLRELGAAFGMDYLKTFLTGFFTDGVRTLSDEEIVQIEEIEKTYLDKDFLLGKER